MPNYGKPALLSMEEVEEVLRNFGNMLQHMLSNQGKWSEMCSKAGQEWDVLDLPGFFMQNWRVKPLFLIRHWYCFVWVKANDLQSSQMERKCNKM